MDTLAVINKLLITSNRSLSTCCCDVSPFYWEMVPCAAALSPRENCVEFDSCGLASRKYLVSTTKCSGPVNLVCEAQRFDINRYNQVATGVVANILSITYVGADSGTVEFTDSGVILNDNGAVTNIAITGTLFGDFVNLIDAEASWSASVNSPPGVSTSYVAYVIGTGQKIFMSNGVTNSFNSRVPGLSFAWNGLTSEYVPFSTGEEVFASGIKTALVRMIGTGMNTVYNGAKSTGVSDGNRRYFDTMFGGEHCGIAQPFITGHVVALFGTGQFVTSTFEYGVYDNEEYLDTNIDCHIFGSSGKCPYESRANSGPPPYISGVNCCPMRGASLGPAQTIGLERLTEASGYCVDGCTTHAPYSIDAWANLENTVRDSDGCYQVSPYYFLFGKEGRFTYDYYNDRRLFVQPDCPFGQSNECGSGQLPENSLVELFIARFSVDAPWGPFGSYYRGIAEDLHKAWEFPYGDPTYPSGQSYLSLTFVERYGADYVPQGHLKTRGEWLKTKELEIRSCIYKPTGFYVGSTENDDKNYRVTLDEATIDPNFVLDYEGDVGESCFTLIYPTSGKTVADFVSGVNSIRTTEGCKIYDFCLGSADAGRLPLELVVNSSAELFQQFVNAAGTAYGGDGPDADSNKLSGCDLTVGLSYWDNFANNPDSINIKCGDVGGYVPLYPVLPSYLEGDINLCPPPEATTPPLCRLYTTVTPIYDGSRGGADFDLRVNTNTWWTAMQGKTLNVLRISKSEFEPFNNNLSDLTISVSNRRINVYCSGVAATIPFARSGYIDTDKGGYTFGANDAVSEINNFSLNKPEGGVFYPLTAEEVQSFAVWLDDATYSDGVNGSYGDFGYGDTTYNYSYKEPLINSDSTSIMESSTTVQSWVRTRCGATVTLPPAVPPSATRQDSDPDCSSDNVVVENWVRSYGCHSSLCVEEYFYRTSRCPCSTVYRCTDDFDGGEVPHPFNQEGTSLANAAYNGYYDAVITVTQPLLYLCEYAIHPNFDIPCLVKVPFQIANTDGGVYGFQGGIFGYDLTGANNLAPYYTEFCSNASVSTKLASNAFGWCQYFDPAAPKVLKEDIPYTNPASAIVVERVGGPFASTNVWNFNPHMMDDGFTSVDIGSPTRTMYFPYPAGQGCSCNTACDACPDCLNWDRIEGAVPAFTNGLDFRWSLTVLFRPILKDVTSNDIIPGTDDCNRIDIDCSTACCECGFTCNNDCNDDLSKHPFTQTVTYSEEYTEVGPAGCDFVWDDPDFCGCTSMSIGVCVYGGAGCASAPCFTEGTITREYSASFTAVYKSCGCRINGTEPSYCTSDIITSDGCDCSGSDSECYHFTCAAPPSPMDRCWTCNTHLNTSCTGTCVPSRISAHRGDYDCGDEGSALVQRNEDFYVLECCNTTTGTCGAYSMTYSYESQNILEGVSPVDGELLGLFGGACGDVHTTWSVTTDISYDITAKQWTDCSYSAGVTAKTYEYISNWRRLYGTFECGYGNIQVAHTLA